MRGACFKVMSGVVSYIITVPILFPWGGGGGGGVLGEISFQDTHVGTYTVAL